MYKINTNEHMCVCVLNYVIRFQKCSTWLYYILKRLRLQFIFFMDYMIKIISKIHWLSCILSSSLQKTDPTPNLPSCTEASGTFSPTTDSSAQPTDGRGHVEGFEGIFPEGKVVRVLKTRHLNPCTGLECVCTCMCAFAVLMRHVCVCVWSTACWRPFNITCTDL